MSDTDIVLNFADLDLSAVDFKSQDWSWGRDGYGSVEIRHCIEDENGFHIKRYPLPPFMLEIISACERHAVGEIKSKLAELDRKRREILEK